MLTHLVLSLLAFEHEEDEPTTIQDAIEDIDRAPPPVDAPARSQSKKQEAAQYADMLTNLVLPLLAFEDEEDEETTIQDEKGQIDRAPPPEGAAAPARSKKEEAAQYVDMLTNLVLP